MQSHLVSGLVRAGKLAMMGCWIAQVSGQGGHAQVSRRSRQAREAAVHRDPGPQRLQPPFLRACLRVFRTCLRPPAPRACWKKMRICLNIWETLFRHIKLLALVVPL